MGSILMVARSDLRRRLVATIVVTLLVGIVGTAVLASAAGARRSRSALARFNTWSRSADIELLADATPAQVRRLEAHPDVVALAPIRTFALDAYNDRVPNLAIGAATDGRFATVVDRPRVIRGRAANPNAVNEVDIGESLARVLHLGVGAGFDARGYTQAQINVFLHGGNGGTHPEGPAVHPRVVGIVRRPLDLGDRGAAGGVVVLTPAFYRAYVDRIGSW